MAHLNRQYIFKLTKLYCESVKKWTGVVPVWLYMGTDGLCFNWNGILGITSFGQKKN